METRPWLRQLSGHVGILAEYTDNQGLTRVTPDSTHERLVTAMGYACATEREARDSLEMMQAGADLRLLPESIIRDSDPPGRLTVPMRVPHHWARAIDWQVEIDTDQDTVLPYPVEQRDSEASVLES